MKLRKEKALKTGPLFTYSRRSEPAVKAEIVGMLALLESDSRVRLVSDDGGGHILPPQMRAILRRAGEIMGQGHDVDVLDASSETFTPNEAADLIGISRPTLLKLIDEWVLTATNIPWRATRLITRLPRKARARNGR